MNIAAFKTEGKLVGDRLANERRAGGERLFDDGSGALRWRLLRQPSGISRAGPAAGDVDQVLDRKRAAIQHAASGRLAAAVRAVNESAVVGRRWTRR